MERIAVPHVSGVSGASGAAGDETSHLAVRFDPPAGGGGAVRESLCFLYLHGFGSVQTGEKADFFRRAALAAATSSSSSA